MIRPADSVFIRRDAGADCGTVDQAQPASIGALAALVGERVFTPSSLIVLGFGIWLVEEGGHRLGPLPDRHGGEAVRVADFVAAGYKTACS